MLPNYLPLILMPVPGILQSNERQVMLEELNGELTMGVKAVTVEIGFPVFDPNFYIFAGQSADQAQESVQTWLNYYESYAQAIHNLGLKMIVESNPLLTYYISSQSSFNPGSYYKSLDFSILNNDRDGSSYNRSGSSQTPNLKQEEPSEMQNTAARKVKQVPEGYLIVGIDPHKKKHAAVAITQDLHIRDKFKLDNTKEGLEFLVRRVRTEMVKSGCRGVMFAIETGGHYWRNIAYFLDEQGIPFRFINQYTLKRRREGKDLNHKKNDYRDSEVAAQLLCTGEFVESTIPQGVYAELRTAHNAYRRLVKERTRITNLIKGLLDGLFPEFVQVFKDPCAVTALCVLSFCAVPGVIAGMTEDEFVATVEAHYHGRRLMRRKLAVLHQVAKASIGIAAGARSVASEMTFLVEKIELIKGHIGTIERTLVKLVDETEEGKYLLSITGLNYIAVAGLLAELGCFKHTEPQSK